MKLTLPYSYRAEFLPARSRVSHGRVVRDYVQADIREVGRSDMVVAFEIRGRGVRDGLEIIFSSPNGGLTKPVRGQACDEALTPLQFEEGLSSSQRRPFDFGIAQLALASGSTGICGLPIAQRTRPSIISAERWKSAIESAPDKERLAAEARVRYEEAFLVVDGILYAQCREPAWFVDHRSGDPSRIRLEIDPTPFWSADLFRIDRLPEARRWASQWSVDASTPDVSVSIAAPELLMRDDVVEIATFGAGPLMTAWCRQHEIYLDDPARKVLTDKVLTCNPGIGPMSRSVAAVFLDAMSEAYGQVTRLYRDTGKSDNPAHIAWLVQRWLFERGMEFSSNAGAHVSNADRVH